MAKFLVFAVLAAVVAVVAVVNGTTTSVKEILLEVKENNEFGNPVDVNIVYDEETKVLVDIEEITKDDPPKIVSLKPFGDIVLKPGDEILTFKDNSGRTLRIPNNPVVITRVKVDETSSAFIVKVSNETVVPVPDGVFLSVP